MIHPDKYLVKVRQGMDASDIYMVEAARLEESRVPGDGNAIEIAAWVSGEAFWKFSPEEGVSEASVNFIEKWVTNNPRVAILNELDWILTRDNGKTFKMMSDEAFRDAFHLHAAGARYICYYCLADTRNTEQSDSENKCPNCSSGYKGNPRTQEFEILKAAGLVLEEAED